MKKRKFYIQLKILLLLVLACFFISSCKDKPANNNDPVPYSQLKNLHKEELMDWNKKVVEIDHDVINKFIERRKWDMEMTETGLYWQIYKENEDRPVLSKDIVEFSYKTYLLNGDVLYTSDETGNRFMKIDSNQEEAGLNEGLKMMHTGEKARLILPPHLAFGVTGDGYKVPIYSILVYEIEVISVISPDEENYDLFNF
ncbi:MAG: FKBP-type peptidyl-prolyl cis-trans isomerase [Bacteroidales bacterium]|jgi:FKBP-type peptidyl-prolyl cis-trans isomerase|nr:FKBP-type peptidyl-prolyl cis-trans isomerase [Bacteroidales bacterium]